MVRLSVPAAGSSRPFFEARGVVRAAFVRARRWALALRARGVADSLTGRFPLVSIFCNYYSSFQASASASLCLSKQDEKRLCDLAFSATLPAAHG